MDKRNNVHLVSGGLEDSPGGRNFQLPITRSCLLRQQAGWAGETEADYAVLMASAGGGRPQWNRA
jgi:hypothetical protein